MRRRFALISTLALLAACNGEVIGGDETPRFPEPDRPVSKVGSNQFSTEDQRDSRGEAKTVMDLAQIAEGMTVADIGAGNGYYTVRLADVCGIALDDCVPRKIAMNARKYPADKARGRSDKYTAYRAKS